MTRSKLIQLAATLAAVVLLIVGVRALFHRPPEGWQSRPGSSKRIAVAPFRLLSPVDGWSAAVFAESLAVRLNASPSVDARVGTVAAGQADYAVEGDVSMSEGHAVIAVRLLPAGQRAAMWSATFWRDKLSDTALAGDLAGRVGEALGITRAQSDSATKKR